MDDAEIILNAEGYELGKQEYRESEAPEGEIIDQSPGSGTEAEKGSRVDVVVSKGTDQIPVPNVIGKPYDEARQILTDAGFVVGEPSYVESDIYKKGAVMMQDPDGGKAKKGSVINLTVSKGEAVVTPDPGPGGEDPGDNPGGGEDNGEGDE